MDYEVQNVKMEEEFKICPSCGYKDGFHSMFKKEGDSTKRLFICPSCSRGF
jgi:transposase